MKTETDRERADTEREEIQREGGATQRVAVDKTEHGYVVDSVYVGYSDIRELFG